MGSRSRPSRDGRGGTMVSSLSAPRFFRARTFFLRDWGLILPEDRTQTRTGRNRKRRSGRGRSNPSGGGRARTAPKRVPSRAVPAKLATIPARRLLPSPDRSELPRPTMKTTLNAPAIFMRAATAVVEVSSVPTCCRCRCHLLRTVGLSMTRKAIRALMPVQSADGAPKVPPDSLEAAALPSAIRHPLLLRPILIIRPHHR